MKQEEPNPHSADSPNYYATNYFQGTVISDVTKSTTDPRPYVCPVCDFAFKEKRHLAQHLRIHSGEKPFRCLYCPKAFARKYTLDWHERIHRDERPFTCHLCPKKFCGRPHLNRHISFHLGIKPYSCPVCLKEFVEKTSLSRHMLTHSGEKPHPCSECDERFSLKTKLNRHLKTRHDIHLPYHCTMCQKQFRLKKEVEYHEMMTHPKEYEEKRTLGKSLDQPEESKSLISSSLKINENATANLKTNLSKQKKEKSVKKSKILLPRVNNATNKDNLNKTDKCLKGKKVEPQTKFDTDINKSTDDHENKPKIKKYYCSCGKSYSSTEVFRKHRERRGHHRPRIHECPICIVETFKTVKGLEKHFNFYHKNCIP